MKYVDDGDHIDDRDNIPVVPVKIRIKFIVVPTTLYKILKFTNGFIIYKFKWEI